MTSIRIWTVFAVAFLVLTSDLMAGSSNRHFIGGGVNYLRTVGELKDDDDWDNDNLSYYVQYQYAPAPFMKFDIEVEQIPDVGPDEDDDIWQPQAYLLVGSSIYAGIGIGMSYVDGDWSDDPFYALRAGLDLELLPSIYLDINANYRFQQFSNAYDLDSDDADQVTFGAAARIGF